MGTNEDHFTHAMHLVASTSFSKVLLSAIKLNIFETIAEFGPNSQLSAQEIASRLSIPNQDAPDMLDRMLMLLASHLVVTCTVRHHASRAIQVYGLTPVAKYFIPNNDGVSLGALVELNISQVYINTWLKLKDSILEGGLSFDKVHGTKFFEYAALDVRFSNIFNTAMTNCTTIMMKELLKCYSGFNNLKRLVDVGGGHGITLNIIVSKHPTINGINFDLPHITQSAPHYPGIEHVGGDMFQEIPRADAIFMKWILHDWSDDHCIMLLKNCYKALPDDGKIIVVDAILPSSLSDTSCSNKAITQMDVSMMTLVSGGGERTEDEFLALAKVAGFSRFKKDCVVCNLGVMEFYK